MRKRILGIIAVIGLLLVLTIPMATPVFATDVALAKNHDSTLGPVHPDDIYLLGMLVYYNLRVNNTSPTLNISHMYTHDILPGASAPGILKASEIFLPWEDTAPGGADTWTGTQTYTLPGVITDPAIEYVPVPPPGKTHYRFVNTLTANGTQGDSDYFDLLITETSYIATPSILVTKVPDKTVSKPGDVVTFNLTVKNDGDWNMTMQSVSDDLFAIPPGSFGDLAVGASQSVFIPYLVPDPPTPITTLVNHFTATYNATGFDPAITGATVSHTATATVSLVHPKYTVDKTANPTSGKVGDMINYTVVITNTGDIQLDLMSAIDSLVTPIPAFPPILAPSVAYPIVYSRAIVAGDKPGPIHNTITTIYQAHGMTNNLTRADSADVTIIPDVPHTALQGPVGISPSQVPPGGTNVTITASDKNTGNVDLNTPTMQLVYSPPGSLVLMTYDSGDFGPGGVGPADGIMQPNEIWVWKYTVPGVTQTTSFCVEGHAVYNSEDFTEASEQGCGSITTMPTPPASSNLAIGIMILGFAGVMAFFIYRRKQRAH